MSDETIEEIFGDEHFEAKWALNEFNVSPCGPAAMIAIRELSEHGYAIPPDLLPWLTKATEAWEAANKRKVKSFRTKHDQYTATLAMALVCDEGKTARQAAEAVHRAFPQFSVDTLTDRYFKGTTKETREFAKSWRRDLSDSDEDQGTE